MKGGRGLGRWLGSVPGRFEERFAWSVGAALAAGVLFRLVLIALTTTPDDPMNRLYPGYTDGEEYLDNARSLVETGVYGYGGRPSAFRPPAYPILLSVSLKLFGASLTPVRLLHVALFVATALCYARITARFFGKVAGVLTAAGFSLYPLFAFVTTEIATENLYMFIAALVFAGALPLLRANGSPAVQSLRSTALGACCGAGILTRSNMLFVFLILQAAIAWRGLRRRERALGWMAPILGLWIGALLVLAPWLVRNQVQLGAPVLGTNLDYNLFRGTFDLVGGIPDQRSIFDMYRENGVIYEEVIEDVSRRTLAWSEVANERNARSAALRIIRSDPTGWVKERFRNLLYLWVNLQWDPAVMHGPLVRIARVSVSMVYFTVLAGAASSLLWLWRGRAGADQRRFMALAMLFILAATSVIITFVGKRYRVSMIDPYLVVLASIGLGSWLDPSRARPDPARQVGEEPVP
jgi:4-amino-4-deoxy-L-arabinose transferase-like glycosyltransferase